MKEQETWEAMLCAGDIFKELEEAEKLDCALEGEIYTLSVDCGINYTFMCC
ncbi:MAG: hypothetical protein HFJ07_00480 [Lachnospiraceae bacterium]|nr:hypothetical protein [Lachnospiraceae bacterium]